MPRPLLVLLLIWVAAAIMMTAGWLWQRRRRNAGIVDVLWSAGLAVSAVSAGLSGRGALGSRLLVAVLGAIWGLRLAQPSPKVSSASHRLLRLSSSVSKRRVPSRCASELMVTVA
ncbi:MAG TPA: DUF1295 domain-containing protein [Steroidobacteraceae bacterium]|nr:DUF1295 domain-containing protein [Steroidobacteraceae bacterium]